MGSEMCIRDSPLIVFRPLNKFKGIPCLKHFKLILTDLLQSGYDILRYIADNPKRSWARSTLSHAARYACDYCVVAGHTSLVSVTSATQTRVRKEIIVIEKKIATAEKAEKNILMSLLDQLKKQETPAKKSNIVWPASTAGGPPRTQELIEEIVEVILSGVKLTPEEAKGITGESIFNFIPYFDLVRDMPAEYLHSVCLGVVKKLVELTFKVTYTPRQRVTKRRLTPPSIFNQHAKSVRFPREFSRRIRQLDFSVMKGQGRCYNASSKL